MTAVFKNLAGVISDSDSSRNICTEFCPLWPSVNNYEITLGIMDLTQCRYKYSNRAMVIYVTNIILETQLFEKFEANIYSVF
jgi:hypothetical protein